jgi:predicted nucleic acid-binding protein
LTDNKKRIVVSDAARLIQLSLAHHLELLPRLHDVLIPQGVFEETQHYQELPGAIEIAPKSPVKLS